MVKYILNNTLSNLENEFPFLHLLLLRNFQIPNHNEMYRKEDRQVTLMARNYM